MRMLWQLSSTHLPSSTSPCSVYTARTPHTKVCLCVCVCVCVRVCVCVCVCVCVHYMCLFAILLPLLSSSSETAPTASPTTQVETVELVKPVVGGLGLLIQESPDQSGVYVQEVVENQAAFLDGRINQGDKILAINHTSTAVASQDTVFKLLQSCVGKVVLTVQHTTVSPVVSTIDFPDSDNSQRFTSQPSPNVKYPFGGEPPQSHIPNRDPPPYPSPFSSYLPPDPQSRGTHMDPQSRGAHAVDPQARGAHMAGGMWGSTQPSLPTHPHHSSLHRSGEGKLVYISDPREELQNEAVYVYSATFRNVTKMET